MKPVRPLALVFVFVFVFIASACNRSAPPQPNARADASATPAAASSPPVAPDAGTEMAGDGTVDLLYATRAVIAVSSKVANPKDFPEHLVDRDPKTAWNSKSGDLFGAWIAFRVPKDVEVRRLEIIVGFDKIAKDGTDLFTANHRIKKVAVSRDGKMIRTHELDPERRDLQSIPIGEAGGDYKVLVLVTVPGTKKEWRELTISEFRVMGTTPRSERLGGEQPRVRVGSLDPPKGSSYEAYRAAMDDWYPTPEAFCEAQMKHVYMKVSDWLADQGIAAKKPACKAARAGKTADALKPPFLDLASVSYNHASSSVDTSLLKTKKGWRLAEELGASWSDEYNPGCPSLFSNTYEEAIEMAPSTTPAILIHRVYSTYSMGGPDQLQTRGLVICRLLGDETLACDKPVGINERIQPYNLDGTMKPTSWQPDVPFTITSDGKIQRNGPFTSARDQKSWGEF